MRERCAASRVSGADNVEKDKVRTHRDDRPASERLLDARDHIWKALLVLKRREAVAYDFVDFVLSLLEDVRVVQHEHGETLD